MADPNQEMTVADKLAQRNGRCVSVATGCTCDGFAFWKKMDGYETCLCTHTKWAHARENGEVNVSNG